MPIQFKLLAWTVFPAIENVELAHSDLVELMPAGVFGLFNGRFVGSDTLEVLDDASSLGIGIDLLSGALEVNGSRLIDWAVLSHDITSYTRIYGNLLAMAA